MEFIDCIRDEMKLRGYDLFLIKDCDPHLSEYVNDYYKFRTVASGFTGSNGTLAVGMDEAFLFTDGRYFIQAEKELSGTSIKLMKLNTPGYPSLKAFINGYAKEGKKTACPSLNFSYREFLDYGIDETDDDNSVFLNAYEKFYQKKYPELNVDDTITILDESLTGQSITSKIDSVKKFLSERNLDYYLSSSLDSNMWLMNVRGRAVECNPVALSYLLVTQKAATFFYYNSPDSPDSKFEDLRNRLKEQGVFVFSYNNFEKYLKNLPGNKRACFLFNKMPVKYARILKDKNYELFDSDCNVSYAKSIKNETELKNIRSAYAKDNKVVSDFIKWVKNRDVTLMNEYDLMKKLDDMRLTEKDCYDLSFTTISASGANAAMMHYESDKDNCSRILHNNLYLVDSGGQWTGATTDITRTIAIGKPSYEMKHDYTLVARGMLTLMNAVFMEGCTGLNLDILAREPMWEEGMDYKCGTGHGVSYMLSVHEEGNHSIRPFPSRFGRDVVLKPGMMLSDEPGIYKEGKYGIRIENILLVKEKCVTSDGRFLCFECLTYVELDEDLIIREEMSPKELKWLDEYMAKCRELN